MHGIRVGNRFLEVIRQNPAHGRTGSAPLVFLHEGLGSVAMWRDFPGRVAHATQRNVVVYSRYAYGQSDALAAPQGSGPQTARPRASRTSRRKAMKVGSSACALVSSRNSALE